MEQIKKVTANLWEYKVCINANIFDFVGLWKPQNKTLPAVIIGVGHVDIFRRICSLGSVQSFGRYITSLVVGVAHDTMHEAWPGPGSAGETGVPLGAVGEGRERLVPARHPERPVVRAVDGEPGRAICQPTLKHSDFKQYSHVTYVCVLGFV